MFKCTKWTIATRSNSEIHSKPGLKHGSGHSVIDPSRPRPTVGMEAEVTKGLLDTGMNATVPN